MSDEVRGGVVGLPPRSLDAMDSHNYSAYQQLADSTDVACSSQVKVVSCLHPITRNLRCRHISMAV